MAQTEETEVGGASAKPASGCKTKTKGRNRTTLIVIAAEAVVAVVIVALIFVWPSISGPTSTSEAPQQIAGRALRGLVTGDEAIAQLQQMHGKGVGIRNGWIAQYDGGGVIWYGVAGSDSEAQSLIEGMTNRIAQGNQTFTDLKTLDLPNSKLYSVKGQGQTHYYYQSGSATVWIALPADKGPDFLHEALTVIK